MKTKHNQIHQKKLALAQEYCELINLPLLSESDADRMEEILEIAKNDDYLYNLIEEIETNNYLSPKINQGLKRLLNLVLLDE